MTTPPPEPPDLDIPPAPTAPPRMDDREHLEALLIGEAKYADNLDAIFGACSPADFDTGSYRKVWEAYQAVHNDGGDINLLTVHDHLESTGELARLGGAAALDEIMCWRHFTGQALHLAEKVHDIARRQRLAQAGRRIAAMASNGEVDVQAVEAELNAELPTNDRGVEKPWDVIEAITERHANPEAQAGIRLGWRALDHLYRVDRGLMSIVTGHPGSGKSSLIDAAMVRLAEHHDWRFAVFSPESAPTDRHTLSLCSVYAGTAWERMSIAEIHPHIEWVNEHFTWIKSTDQVTLDEVLRRADIIRRREQIDGLVVDPWNELADQRNDSVTETQHISHSLTKLRRWGRRHGIHIWVIAHPKKQEKRADGTYPVPSLYDVAGSATWYDKADMGVVVHRDKLTPGPVSVQIVKVRFRQHGQLGSGRLHFDVPTGRYFDIAPEAA